MNYGTPEDYEQLAKLGVDVKGKIVIARYGRSWRGIKPKVAYEHGAIGCIIYSDPREDGFFQGDVFPTGPYRPEQGAQRGSVMDMPIHPGDPLTPGTRVGAGRTAAGSRRRRRPSSRSRCCRFPTATRCRCCAISKGPVAPESWRGALPITYHVGAGPAKVHLKLAFDWSIRPLYNVIVRIDGSRVPDEWIIHGNHHDAWVNGASDPTSGNVALMETARGLGELLKTGWRPKRTIILASWDGEEWGLLGSTEWAEKHAQELSAEGGRLHQQRQHVEGLARASSGSHSLQAFVNDVMRDVAGSEARRARRCSQAKLDRAVEPGDEREHGEARSCSRARRLPDRRARLGIGLHRVPRSPDDRVARHGIRRRGSAAASTTPTYDSFYWYTHFSDTDFAYGAALSRTIGTAILRLADADILPFEFTATARTLRGYVDEIDKALRKRDADAPPLDLDAGAQGGRAPREGRGRLRTAAAGDRAAAARSTARNRSS